VLRNIGKSNRKMTLKLGKLGFLYGKGGSDQAGCLIGAGLGQKQARFLVLKVVKKPTKTILRKSSSHPSKKSDSDQSGLAN
jgi:hypothetical protein